jgi:beta-phosphoglucomutase
MNIKAVIFDMDGVLVDSEPIHAKAWQQTLIPFNIDFPEEGYSRWFGVSDIIMAEHFIKVYNLPATKEELLGMKRERTDILIRKEVEFFEGVSESINNLKGKKLGLVTSSTREEVNAVLYKDGMQDTFDIIVTSDDVKFNKPYPECYLLAAEKMNIPPGQCVVIEDTNIGIQAANAAGMFVIGVTNSYPAHELEGTKMIFSSTKQAIEWIINENPDNEGTCNL